MISGRLTMMTINIVLFKVNQKTVKLNKLETVLVAEPLSIG